MIHNGKNIDLETIEKIKKRMWELIDADLPFLHKSVRTVDAAVLFRERGMNDKARYVESLSSPIGASKYTSLIGTFFFVPLISTSIFDVRLSRFCFLYSSMIANSKAPYRNPSNLPLVESYLSLRIISYSSPQD